MAQQGEAARAAALRMIGQVHQGRLMTELLPRAVQNLPEADRARAQRLAATTLRWSDRADRILGPYLRQRPVDEVLHALRLGVVELAVDRAAPHGVINAMVNLVKLSPETRRASGLVNAVLRRVSEDLDKWETLPLPRLPKALRKMMIAAYGKEAVAAMEAAHSKGAPLDLSAKGDGAALAEAVGGVLLPNGSVRLADAGRVSALPGYEAGDWWVQDAEAAFPALALAAKPGERVLDMCAAPGGKTMQLAAAGADVTALDVSEFRMGRVQENLTRTGLKAQTVVADALEFEDSAAFDAILLDAPCTATGTIRRHPDLPYAKAETDFAPLFELQAKMIDKALTLLRPGGRLIYCTCSLFPDEGEVQIEDALARHTSLKLDNKALDLPGVDPAWMDDVGLRLRPDYWADMGGMDGFFVGCLRLPE